MSLRLQKASNISSSGDFLDGLGIPFLQPNVSAVWIRKRRRIVNILDIIVVIYIHIVIILDKYFVIHLIGKVSSEKYGRIYKVIGQAIADARKNAGRRITQQQLSDRTGGELSRSAVANIECGRQRFAVHQLYMVARCLGVEPGKLLPPMDDVFEESSDMLAHEIQKDPKLAPWLSKVIRKEVVKE